MHNAIHPEIERLSKNLWRPSQLKPDGWDRTVGLVPAPEIRPETPNESQFFELPGSAAPDRKPAIEPTVESLVASSRRSSEQLQQTLGSYSKRDYHSISASDISHLRDVNPVAQDRIDALTDEQRGGTVMAGGLGAITLWIPSGQAIPRWEEVFRAVRSPSGATEVMGKRFHQGEWYHFSSRIAAPPQTSPWGENSQPMPAPRASTVFAPTKIAENPDHARVVDAVRGITQGPWKPYLQGKTLKGSDHDVKGVQSDKPNAMKAFKAKFDSVVGVLKNIQDVAKGIQEAADFLGLAGELGKFGDVLSWIGSIKLPEKPADVIKSILTGSGILPGKAQPTHGSICVGSGEGGLVVTKGGAAAAAFGNGLVNQVGVVQNGDGSAPKAPGSQNKTVPAKGSPNASQPKDDDPSKNPSQPGSTDPQKKKDPDGLADKVPNASAEAIKNTGELEQKRAADAEKNSLESKAAESRTAADEAKSRADAAEQAATSKENAAAEKVASAENSKEYLEGQNAQNDAHAARHQADLESQRASDLEAKASADAKAVSDFDPKRVSGAMDDLGRAAGRLGAVGDAVGLGINGYNAYNMAMNEDYRGAAGELGKGVGGFAGGAYGAAKGAAGGMLLCGPPCAVVGGLVGGVAGGALGEQFGQNIAEAGFDSVNRSTPPTDEDYQKRGMVPPKPLPAPE